MGIRFVLAMAVAGLGCGVEVIDETGGAGGGELVGIGGEAAEGGAGGEPVRITAEGAGGAIPLDCGPCGLEVDGACEPAPAGVEACGAYVCDGASLECPLSCDEHADCSTGNACLEDEAACVDCIEHGFEC